MNILFILLEAVVFFLLFFCFYKLGYHTGRLDEIQNEKAILQEWRESSAEIFTAWEKDIQDFARMEGFSLDKSE